MTTRDNTRDHAAKKVPANDNGERDRVAINRVRAAAANRAKLRALLWLSVLSAA